MSELGTRAPYWRTQATTGYVYPPTGWDADWYYHFRVGEYKHIEWCEITPRETAETVSIQEVLKLCKVIGFEVISEERIVRILGYRRL